ncbi:MAG: glycosyltransferase family 4 protein [Allopontixanthobacter sediminis]
MSDDRLTICFPLIGEILGGSHVSLKGLLDRLPPDKYRVLIVCDQNGSRISRFFDDFEQIPDPVTAQRDFAVGQPFGWRKIAAAMRGLPHRAKLLREQGVDIVHTNDGQNHAYWGLAAKLAGTAHVWHHRSDPTARGIRFMAPLLADRIVAVSEFALPAKRWGSLRHARVIHSPFDVSATIDRASARRKLVEELGCREDAVLCGYFGLFIDRKKPLDFIAAVRELGKRTGKPTFGLLFGEAADDALYIRILSSSAASMEQANIRLMGFRSPGIDWISACDVLLVPAIGEPLGRTLVEAMLAGTPVVATRSGGNAEALAPDHGVLVPPDNPGAMAEAVDALLRDPVRCRAMTDRARDNAVTRFSAERHVSQIEQVYEQLRTARSTL